MTASLTAVSVVGRTRAAARASGRAVNCFTPDDGLGGAGAAGRARPEGCGLARAERYRLTWSSSTRSCATRQGASAAAAAAGWSAAVWLKASALWREIASWAALEFG